MPVPFSRRFRGQLARLTVLVGLVALAASTGCSKGGNVTLQAQFSLTEPAVSNGDTNSDGWADANLTPTGFAMAIQSATLTNSTPGDTAVIFDKGVDTTQALFTRLYNSPTKVLIQSKNDIPNGTYNQLTLQVVFYEAEVDAYDTTLHHRRLRAYLQDSTDQLIKAAVKAFDLLIGNGATDFIVPTSGNPADVGDTGKDLNWINPTDGSVRCATRVACEVAGNPYQVPTTVFPDAATVTIALPTIVVDSNTDMTFVITLTAKIQDLFFYDSDGNDGNITQFNYLSDITVSKDGKIDKACSNPSDCSTSDPKAADFWIGPPNFSLAVTSQ